MYELESIQRIVKLLATQHMSHDRRNPKIQIVRDMLEKAMDKSWSYNQECQWWLWCAFHVIADAAWHDGTHSDVKARLWLAYECMDKAIHENTEAPEIATVSHNNDFAPPDKDMDDLPF